MQENTPLKAIININGKEAIVTGGSRRIGLAISSRLTDAGAVVLIADINAREAGSLCSWHRTWQGISMAI